MKRFLFLSALASATAVSPAVAQDTETKAKPKVAVVVGEPIEVAKDENTQVQVFTVEGEEADKAIAEIEKQLENAKLDPEARKKILDGVRKAMAEKPAKGEKKVMAFAFKSKHSDGDKVEAKDIQVKVDGDHIVVTEDGKEKKIQIKKIVEGKPVEGNTFEVTVNAEDGKENRVQIKKLESTSKAEVKVDGEAVIIGKDGKENRIKLRQLSPLTAQGQGFTFEAIDGDHIEKMLEAMKANGLDEKTIEKVEKSLREGLGAKHGMVAGFPLSQALPVMEDRFMIGVQVNMSHAEDGENESDELRVENVFEGSPAAEAGIKKGDILISANDKPCETPADLIEAVQEAGKGDKKVKAVFSREGNQMVFEIAPKKGSTLSSLQSLPADLKAQLDDLSGKTQALLLPHGTDARTVMGTFMPNVDQSEELEELRDEIKDLRSELKELKELIKGLKK